MRHREREKMKDQNEPKKDGWSGEEEGGMNGNAKEEEEEKREKEKGGEDVDRADNVRAQSWLAVWADWMQQ